MANKRISELPEAATLQDSDLLAVVQENGPENETRKVTMGELRNVVGCVGIGGGYAEMTYAELFSLVENNELIIGRRYCITDFETIYRQPISNEIKVADSGESLIVTAISENSFAKQVQSLQFPNDEIEYEFTSTTQWNVVSTPYNPAEIESKGQIVYRKDENGNECGYDFRTIKFRRWATNYDAQTELYSNYVIPLMEKTYNGNTQQYEKTPYGNGAFVYQDEEAYEEFLTFTQPNNSYGNTISVENRNLPNIVYMGNAHNNTIIAASDITFGGSAYNNHITSNGSNTYYSDNVSLNFITGSRFANNVIKGNILQNTVFSGDTINNMICGQNGAFRDNYFGHDCQSNVLKSTWGGGINNTIAYCFKFNEIHCKPDVFNNNTIDYDFSHNRISGTQCFNFNTISNRFQNNVISGNNIFIENTVGGNFLYNSVTGNNTAKNCVFGDYCEHNVINQALQHCTLGSYNAYNEFYYDYGNARITTGDVCKHILIQSAMFQQGSTITFGAFCENIEITKNCNFNGNVLIAGNICDVTIARTYTNRDLHINSDHFNDIGNMISNGIDCKVFGNDNNTDTPIRIKYGDVDKSDAKNAYN
jgi:hypothetical protein